MTTTQEVKVREGSPSVDSGSSQTARLFSTREDAFFTVWELAAPIERVWEELRRPEHYPEWFPYVKQAEQVSAGDAEGVGAVTRSRWTTDLPYGFVLETRTTRVAPPYLIEWKATGDLEGTGRWEVSEDAGVTTARYYWTVRTTKLWMRFLAPLLLPAFNWNHAVVMQKGGKGLAERLGAPLVGNRSYSGESTNVLLPLSRTAGLVSLAALVALVARFLRRLCFPRAGRQ